RPRKRHGPIARSAGRPKVSRNTRLPSRWAQSACGNSALSRRSQWPPSIHGCQGSAFAGPPASAPHSSISARWLSSEREIAQTKAAHRAAASSGVAQRREVRVRVGTDTNMPPTLPVRAAANAKPRAPSRAGTHVHHTAQYGIVRRASWVGRENSGGEGGHGPPATRRGTSRHRRETHAMRKIPHVTVLALGIAGAMAFASNVQAAGFQLKENSVKSQGSSFAGTAAKTGDSSVVVNNP